MTSFGQSLVAKVLPAPRRPPTAMDDLGDAVLMGDIELLLPQLIV
jgi:hypothetical protein